MEYIRQENTIIIWHLYTYTHFTTPSLSNNPLTSVCSHALQNPLCFTIWSFDNKLVLKEWKMNVRHLIPFSIHNVSNKRFVNNNEFLRITEPTIFHYLKTQTIQMGRLKERTNENVTRLKLHMNHQLWTNIS